MTLVQKEPKSIKIWTTNIKRVTIRPNGTEKQIRPDTWWQPWANTLFYASLNWNTNSEWTLSPTFNSQSWTITYPSLWSIQYAYLNSGQIIWDIWTYTTSNITLQARVSWGTAWVISTGKIYWPSWPNVWIELYFNGSSSWWWYTQNNVSWYGTTVSWSTNTRCLITFVKSWTSLALYKNWWTPQTTTCSSVFNVFDKLYIANNDRSPLSNFQIKVSNIIMEDKARTAQEISDYYNLTKWTYWL